MFCGPIPPHKVFGSLGFRLCRQLFGCLDVKRSTTQWCNCHGGFLASAYAKDEVSEQKFYMFVTPKLVKSPSHIWRINQSHNIHGRLYTTMDPMRNTKHDGAGRKLCHFVISGGFFFFRLFAPQKRTKTRRNSRLKVFRWAPLPILKKVGL